MTETTTTGGFDGSPLEALTPVAETGGCCGGASASAEDSAQPASGGCCGTAAPETAAPSSAPASGGCCG